MSFISQEILREVCLAARTRKWFVLSRDNIQWIEIFGKLENLHKFNLPLGAQPLQLS